MANWKYKLDLKDLITAHENGELTVPELSKKIAERIKEQPWYEEEMDDLEDIVLSFECIEDEESFDYIMNELYDWGDTTLPTPRRQMPVFNKKCWIATIF